MPDRRRACLVPGMGIRPAEDPGLVAPAPVSVERDGAAMTVTHLFSGGGHLGFNTQPDDADGRWSWVGVTLPSEPPDQAVVTFRYPLVAVAGPWRLSLPAPLFGGRRA